MSTMSPLQAARTTSCNQCFPFSPTCFLQGPVIFANLLLDLLKFISSFGSHPGHLFGLELLPLSANACGPLIVKFIVDTQLLDSSCQTIAGQLADTCRAIGGQW